MAISKHSGTLEGGTVCKKAAASVKKQDYLLVLNEIIKLGGQLGKFECEQDINSLEIFKCILLLNLCKRMFLILGNAHWSI